MRIKLTPKEIQHIESDYFRFLFYGFIKEMLNRLNFTSFLVRQTVYSQPE